MEEQSPGNHGEKDSQCMKINFEIATTENLLGNQQEMTKRMCVRKKIKIYVAFARGQEIQLMELEGTEGRDSPIS